LGPACAPSRAHGNCPGPRENHPRTPEPLHAPAWARDTEALPSDGWAGRSHVDRPHLPTGVAVSWKRLGYLETGDTVHIPEMWGIVGRWYRNRSWTCWPARSAAPAAWWEPNLSPGPELAASGVPACSSIRAQAGLPVQPPRPVPKRAGGAPRLSAPPCRTWGLAWITLGRTTTCRPRPASPDPAFAGARLSLAAPAPPALRASWNEAPELNPQATYFRSGGQASSSTWAFGPRSASHPSIQFGPPANAPARWRLAPARRWRSPRPPDLAATGPAGPGRQIRRPAPAGRKHLLFFRPFAD